MILPAAALEHRRADSPGQHELARSGRPRGRGPSRRRGCSAAGARRDRAGVVHQDVDRRDGRSAPRPARSRPPGRPKSHAGAVNARPAAVDRRARPRCPSASRCAETPMTSAPGRGQRLGHRQPDTPAGAGHDGEPAGQVERVGTVRCVDRGSACAVDENLHRAAAGSRRSNAVRDRVQRHHVREISRSTGTAPAATSWTARSKSSRWYSRAPSRFQLAPEEPVQVDLARLGWIPTMTSRPRTASTSTAVVDARLRAGHLERDVGARRRRSSPRPRRRRRRPRVEHRRTRARRPPPAGARPARRRATSRAAAAGDRRR